ncbi:hypothetical protein GPALN_012427 [Globodera pallida]|nr:hypothetical protein GPALN_012427 [Globodera pallida]
MLPEEASPPFAQSKFMAPPGPDQTRRRPPRPRRDDLGKFSAETLRGQHNNLSAAFDDFTTTICAGGQMLTNPSVVRPLWGQMVIDGRGGGGRTDLALTNSVAQGHLK